MNKNAWIEKAKELGIEHFEIYQSISKSKEVTWYEGQMDTYVVSDIKGTSIRGIIEGHTAYMALENDDDSQMETVLNHLKEQALIVSSQEECHLVSPMEIDYIQSDKVWKQPEMEQVYTLLKTIEQKVLAYDPRISQVGYLTWNEGSGSRQITNSLGLQVKDEDQIQYIACTAIATEDGEYKDETSIELIYDIDTFDIDQYVKKLCEQTLQKLKAHSISTRTCPVILEKEAMTSLFGTLSGMFNGESIAKEISPISKRLNEKIFSEKITVIDDPKNKDSLSIVNFDDEGYPTYKKTVVDKGVFKTILHNTKSAVKMNTQSTGNGFKSSYASSVGISPMNFYIEPGTKTLSELEEMMQNGLVITEVMGLHAGIRHVTTDFSLQASGYWIQNGKRSQAVTLITIAANFLDMMNHVVEVGNDLEWKYRQIACPSILFESCAISGE